MIDFQQEDRTQQRVIGAAATFAYAALVLLLLGYRFGMSAVQAQDVMQPLGELVRGTGRSLCTLGRSAVQTVRDLMREAQTARG